MTCLSRKTSWAVLLIMTINQQVHAAVACVADGVTDVTACLQAALYKAQANGTMQVNLANGTYIINNPLTIPSGVQLIGTGRGDAGYIGTVLQVGATFAFHGSVVEMGTAGAENVGVLVKDMTIDGEGLADYALEDLYAGDRSRGEDLSLLNFQVAGLHVAGVGASGAGPFKDLEIYPLEFATTSTNCILVHNVPFFLGVEGGTCNAGNSSGLRPSVAVQADGNGVYSDIHIESYVMGYQLGSATTAADGIVVRNGQLGPGVDTALTITSSTANQNISLFGISCYSCSITLNDLVTGNSQYWTVGWYLEGSGLPISNRRLFSSNANTSNNLGDHPPATVSTTPATVSTTPATVSTTPVTVSTTPVTVSTTTITPQPNVKTIKPYSHLRTRTELSGRAEQ